MKICMPMERKLGNPFVSSSISSKAPSIESEVEELWITNQLFAYAATST